METSDPRSEAAHHEAGHAVAAEMLPVVGLPARRVRRVVLGPRGVGVTILEPSRDALSGVAGRAAVIVFTLAGPLAQRRHRGGPVPRQALATGQGGSEADVAAAARLADGLACGPRWREAWLEHLREETLRLSRDPAFWPCVDAVAGRLALEGWLDGEAVRRLMRDAGARLESRVDPRGGRVARPGSRDDSCGGRVAPPRRAEGLRIRRA